MRYRYCSSKDMVGITNLMNSCFGNTRHNWAEGIETGRYLVAEDETTGKLVAMTGFYRNAEFNAPEIDWTCCLEEHRKQGIMTHLFELILEQHNETVYCSAWHLDGKERANLDGILQRFGFKLVINAYKEFRSDFSVDCVDCRFRNDKEENVSGVLSKTDLYIASMGGVIGRIGADSNINSVKRCHCCEDLYVRKV